MKKAVYLAGGLIVSTFAASIAIHIYVISQVWGSGLWVTTLTVIGLGFADAYWAYQWWHGFGWNLSSTVVVVWALNILSRIADKALCTVLEIETQEL